MCRLVPVILSGILLIAVGCATAPSPPPTTQETKSPQPEPEKANNSQATLPEDEEDALGYRLLAAPEYLWKGIT